MATYTPENCPSYFSKALEVLQTTSDKHFAGWLKTKPGEKWRKQLDSKRKRPYQMGFRLPEDHKLLTEALNKGDENDIKVIMLRMRTEDFYYGDRKGF